MIKTVGRRQFLVGSGCTLGIPLLGSLLSRRAEAACAMGSMPRFVAMMTQHGGVWGSNMYPAESTLDQQHGLYAGHVINHGALSLDQQDGMASLSPVLSASDAALTPELVSKMMVLRGLDISMYMGHNSGGPLGNFFAGSAGGNGLVDPIPTIDQVMAYSPSFYSDLSTVMKRSMHIGSNNHGPMSWGHANPNDPNSPIQEIPVASSSLALFNEIFVPPDEDDEPKRPLMVDRVMESYKRLTQGAFGHAARLSAEDRARLDDHLERLFELERRLNVQASCENVAVPTEEANDYDHGGYATDMPSSAVHYQLYNDVVMAAFACGTSRVAVYRSTEKWSTDVAPGDWHDEVAHQAAGNQVAQDTMWKSKQFFFEHVFLDLVRKMDTVVDANGKTMLDNSFAFWTQESGNLTHHSVSLPVVSFGSADGYFDTGRMVDYRNQNNMELLGANAAGEGATQRPGILYNRFLANVLMAMCIPPSEFERDGNRGYGGINRHLANGGLDPHAAWPDQLNDDASDPLPVVT